MTAAVTELGFRLVRETAEDRLNWTPFADEEASEQFNSVPCPSVVQE